jgi:hypothetical protein
MSIQTSRKDTYQIIRFVSDMVMESDANAVKEVVEQALQTGIKNFVFSVSVGSLSNRRTISRILLWCNETIRRWDGRLLFIEKDADETCVFRDLCESLKIPLYRNLETALVTRQSRKKKPEPKPL